MAKQLKSKAHFITERFLITLLKHLYHSDKIHKRSINNIAKMFNVLDIEHYDRDPTIRVLLSVIETVNDERLRGIPDTEYVDNKIEMSIPTAMKEVKENIVYPIIRDQNPKPVSERELELINESIQTFVENHYTLTTSNRLMDFMSEIQSGSLNMKTSIDKYKREINSIANLFKSTENTSDQFQLFHTSDDDFTNIYLKETYESAMNPDKVLKTGIKLVNEFFSQDGGILPKYHLLVGDTNSFKSGTLLWLAETMRANNGPQYQERFEETGKRPTVLYVSLENSEDEDRERLFSMWTGSSITEKSTYQEVLNAWSSRLDSTNSLISMTLLRCKNGIRASQLDGICDQLWEDGFDVIGVVTDYLERFLPEIEDIHLEDRNKLKHISEIHHNLSKERIIPVFTAQQMNREGGKIIAEMKHKGEPNIGKYLNKNMIGESHGIAKAADFIFFVVLEKSPYDGKTYWTIWRFKARYKEPLVGSVCHELSQGFYLKSDIHLREGLSTTELSPTDVNIDIIREKLSNDYTKRGKPLGSAESTLDKFDNKEDEEKPKEKDTSTVKSMSLSSMIDMDDMYNGLGFTFVPEPNEMYENPIEMIEGEEFIFSEPVEPFHVET